MSLRANFSSRSKVMRSCNESFTKSVNDLEFLNESLQHADTEKFMEMVMADHAKPFLADVILDGVSACRETALEALRLAETIHRISETVKRRTIEILAQQQRGGLE